jgi:hypothetical protein
MMKRFAAAQQETPFATRRLMTRAQVSGVEEMAENIGQADDRATAFAVDQPAVGAPPPRLQRARKSSIQVFMYTKAIISAIDLMSPPWRPAGEGAR